MAFAQHRVDAIVSVLSVLAILFSDHSLPTTKCAGLSSLQYR